MPPRARIIPFPPASSCLYPPSLHQRTTPREARLLTTERQQVRAILADVFASIPQDAAHSGEMGVLLQVLRRIQAMQHAPSRGIAS